MAGNANSGRRPQPTSLKLLKGEKNKDRINENEPVPPAGEVVKPSTLSMAAGLAWDEMAPVCVAMGTLTPADVKPFATLCELQATIEMASSQKNAEGFAPFTVSDDYNGAPTVKIHAALKLERETATALRPYYEKFGLEPAGRSRIKVPKRDAAPVSKWAGTKVSG